MKTPIATIVLATLTIGPFAAKLTAESSRDDQGRVLLMVDDHHVLYRSGTQRVIHPAERFEGNPLIKSTKPWEVAIAWTSIHRDAETGKYQLWYQAWSGNKAKDRTRQCVTCYAESDDGIHFTKPDLDLFDYNGIEKTNIVMVGHGGTSVRYANSVLVDPREKDPQRRYKMGYFDFVTDENGKETPGLCVAFSPDGIHWTNGPDLPRLSSSYGRHGDPVPQASEVQDRKWQTPLSMADAVDVFYDPQRKVFAFYGKMWMDGPTGGMYWKHGMGRTESKDFINWTKPELVLTPDDLDKPTVEFHTSPVFYHEGVYFCLNQILDRGTGGGVIDIELMISRDGFSWDRPFRDQWFLARSEGLVFDSGSMFTNSTPIVLDDEIRFYYGGYSDGATDADDSRQISGVGLATIPLNRIAGIRPMARSDQPTLRKPLENRGQVTLKPLELSPSAAIYLNADAVEGSITVELLNEEGFRMDGWTRDSCTPVKGDDLRHVVQWKDKSLSDLPEGRYMIRIFLDNATLYAVSIE